MLSHEELINILHTEGVDDTCYTIDTIKELFGEDIPEPLARRLLEDMAYVAIDMDTKLSNIIHAVTEFDMNLAQIRGDEEAEQSDWYDVLDYLLESLKVCRENAARLVDLIKEIDSLTAYNLIFTRFYEYFPPDKMEKIKNKALKIFDKECLYI